MRTVARLAVFAVAAALAGTSALAAAPGAAAPEPAIRTEFAAPAGVKPSPALGPTAASAAPYVRPRDLDLDTVIPAPPADDSPQTRAELDALETLAETRTPNEVVRARSDAEEEDVFVFRDVMGSARFDASQMPLLAALSQRLADDAAAVVAALKARYARPRPYTLDPALATACPRPPNTSYPSGHAAIGRLEAGVLAEILPERRNVITARAARYARAREVCGVHFASDVAAGETLGRAMFARVDASPRFRADLFAVRSEVREALELAP